MPALRTEISEIATALGMLYPDDPGDLDTAISSRPAQMFNVPEEVWDRLVEARTSAMHEELFASAWENGRAFFLANDGLDHRPPRRIEWKGPTRPVGYEAVPADLRVDHVYLVSCKHRSRVLHNVSPAHLMDRGLISRRGEDTVDWYWAIAKDAYQSFYEHVREWVRDGSLPEKVRDLTPSHRPSINGALPARDWPDNLREEYLRFASAVSEASAHRWASNLITVRAQEEQVWRLLRLASAPYFLLGASPRHQLRLRVATPWDWRREFRFVSLSVFGDRTAGQPLVRWKARVHRLIDGAGVEVEGFVEIRWSHGRFCGFPEAKVQLITPHEEVPGYFPLR